MFVEVEEVPKPGEMNVAIVDLRDAKEVVAGLFVSMVGLCDGSEGGDGVGMDFAMIDGSTLDGIICPGTKVLVVEGVFSFVLFWLLDRFSSLALRTNNCKWACFSFNSQIRFAFSYSCSSWYF